MKTYVIVKQFTSGVLKGLRIEEITSARFHVGQTYGGCHGSKYLIVSVKEVR